MSTSSITVRLASDPAERAAAQRLRYEVFQLEGRLPPTAPPFVVDADDLDPWCDHLLAATEDGRIVGSSRLLTEEAAAEAGFAAEAHFDVAALRARGWRLLEVGRSCVHPAFRDGSVVRALFKGLMGYQKRAGADALFGVVSLPGFDPIEVTGVMGYLHHHQAAGYPLVTPYRPFPLPPGIASERPDPGVFWRLPPPFKAWLRLGARLAGPPAVNREYGSTDFLLVLPLASEASWFHAA